uniref:Uncharacterized protein n=1 Tax=Oryza nivara TaxID=4536 RepID=A0A0E0IXU5_ORYNI
MYSVPRDRVPVAERRRRRQRLVRPAVHHHLHPRHLRRRQLDAERVGGVRHDVLQPEPDLPRQPVLGDVVLADREDEIAVRVQFGVPLPQPVLPVLVFGDEDLVEVFGIGIRDEELCCTPVRNTHLPQCWA